LWLISNEVISLLLLLLLLISASLSCHGPPLAREPWQVACARGRPPSASDLMAGSASVTKIAHPKTKELKEELENKKKTQIPKNDNVNR
jgi:hypothetical protein